MFRQLFDKKPIVEEKVEASTSHKPSWHWGIERVKIYVGDTDPIVIENIEETHSKDGLYTISLRSDKNDKHDLVIKYSTHAIYKIEEEWRKVTDEN